MTERPKVPGNALATNATDDWVLLQRQCKTFIASDFLPESITHENKRPIDFKRAMAKALTIATKGRELGLSPLYALSHISIVKGKPCLSAELMLALVYQRYRDAKITFLTPPEKQNTECTIRFQRPYGGDAQLFRFTIEDAKQAGLVKPDSSWTKYPAHMLRWRAISAGARAVFPECIMGCYTPEEMGAEVIDVGEFEAGTRGIMAGEASNNNTVAEDERVVPAVSQVSTTNQPQNDQDKAAAYADTKPDLRPREDARGFPHGEYPKANPGWENDPSTEPQRKKLWAMAKTAGYDETQLKDLVFTAFNVERTRDLTKGQIQKLFKDFESAGAAQ